MRNSLKKLEKNSKKSQKKPHVMERFRHRIHIQRPKIPPKHLLWSKEHDFFWL